MWGGRKLETILGRALPPGSIGESWEIFDFPPGVVDHSSGWISSEISTGAFAGKTLHQLTEDLGRDLLGSARPVGPHRQFPLLIKFLDAREDLSVQVHPDESYAKKNPDAHLKNEAWFVLQADRGARLLKGLKNGVNRAAFEKAIADGSVESTIQSIPVKFGDCFYLPSGTVHALGAGILAAEVQTPSDTTYRVYDFNRVDPSTGKLRTLHIDQALQCIDFSNAAPEKPSGSNLAACDYFSLRKLTASPGNTATLPGGEPIILMMISGNGELLAGGKSTPFHRGETILLPAALADCRLSAAVETLALQVSLGPSNAAG